MLGFYFYHNLGALCKLATCNEKAGFQMKNIAQISVIVQLSRFSYFTFLAGQSQGYKPNVALGWSGNREMIIIMTKESLWLYYHICKDDLLTGKTTRHQVILPNILLHDPHLGGHWTKSNLFYDMFTR